MTNIFKTFSQISLLILFSGGLITGCCSTGNWELLVEDQESHSPVFTHLYFNNSNHGWALARDFLESDDGGKTWKIRLEGSENTSFHSFTFINETTGWMVGSENNTYKTLILKTTDGGKSWDKQITDIPPAKTSSEAPYLHSISFCDQNNGWAVGRNKIIYTSDGGNNWKTQYTCDKDVYLYDIYASGPNLVWAVGSDGTVLHTEDGGVQWQKQDTGLNTAFNRIKFFNGNGWIVGTNGTFLRSKDNGKNWKRQDLDTKIKLTDCFSNGSEVWIIGHQGTIMYSSDSGNKWCYKDISTTTDLLCLYFLNSKTGWIGGKQKTLFRYR